MYYTVYKVVNSVNGKEYIGKHQTEKLNDGYLGSGKYLRRALKVYGKDNLTKHILYVFHTAEEMNSKEAEIVTENYCRQQNNYNLKPGGSGGFALVDQRKGALAGAAARKILNETPEFRARMQEWNKIGYSKGLAKYKANPDFKPHDNTGYKHTSEFKNQLSLARKGQIAHNRKLIRDENGNIFPSIQHLAKDQNVRTATIDYRLKKGIYSFV